MEIKKVVNGDSLTIQLIGRLDATNAPELEKELNQSFEGVKDLVFDLDQLDYISSAGLRVLLIAQKHMMKVGTLKVKNVNDVIMDIFEVTGFIDIIDIEPKE